MKGFKNFLNRAPAWVSIVYASLVTFTVYSCMYGFRKAFTVAGYDGASFLMIDYKIWLITSQVLGYMASKFYGIRFIGENSRKQRSKTIVKLVLISWLALLCFAVTPKPYNIIFLFINGFPLGLVWGLVFSFLEGRRFTELMGAVLACSFIFASGFAKTVGKFMIDTLHVPEIWMPFTTGALFFVPLVIFSLLLEYIPEPNAADRQSRTERKPMDKEARSSFIKRFSPGLITVIAGYILLTIMRDFRDNFANEILSETGNGVDAALFTRTEVPVMVVLLLVTGALVLIRNNLYAFLINHLIICFGFLVAGLSTLFYVQGMISSFNWFWITGAGFYLGYIPFNCLYFERMLAVFKVAGNVGFLMYLADSFGYMGSVLVLFVKQFGAIDASWSSFYISAVYIAATSGILLNLVAMNYFRKKSGELKIVVA